MAIGFGIVTILLAAIVGAAAWQAQAHQAALAELEAHSRASSQLQDAEASASISGLLLQRYVIAGEEIYVQEIQENADAAQAAMAAALQGGTVRGLDDVYSTGTRLVQDAARVSELVQNGNIAQAEALMEQIVPVFREYRLQLQALASEQAALVVTAREDANATAELTLILLIASGAIGVAFIVIGGFLLSRSIIKPLSKLEDTARAVSSGDLSARAPTIGQAELAHLGLVMNDMMEAIEQDTEELRRANEELQDRHRELTDVRSQAATDQLTGLGNHRSFHKRLQEQVASAGDSGSSVGLILMDIDGFKDVNDRQGHQAGDKVLRNVAKALVDVTERDHC